MTTFQLIALDLGLTVLVAALWLGAGVVSTGLLAAARRGQAVLAGSLAAGGAAVTVGRVAVVAALAGRGWWFVQEKLLVALPLVLLPALVAGAVAGPALVVAVRRGRRPSPLAPAALLATGYGGVAGVVVTLAMGYPATVAAGLGLAAVVAALAGLTWLVLSGRRGRPLVIVAALGVTGLVAPAAVAAAGGAPAVAEPGGVSVAQLRTAADAAGPVRRFELTAQHQDVTLPSGRTMPAWTFGSLPGPELTVTEGELVEVVLRNTDIADGVSLHWHGYDVPNGEDGVAGVTQDAVLPGQSFVYRFHADQAGTYWYHTHQLSAGAVRRGLFGTLVVQPRQRAAGVDLTVPVHTIDGAALVRASDRLSYEEVPAGTPVRLRLVNTDPSPHRFSLADARFRVVAVDGRDLLEPPDVSDLVLRVPAGGRYDVAFTMPDRPVALAVEAAPEAGLVLRPPGADGPAAAAFAAAPVLDLLDYGRSGSAPPTRFDRDYTVVLDRQLRLLDGTPQFAYTVNGAVYPNVAPLVVREGEAIRLTVVNRGSDTHPMHPHGHHVRVLSRDGVAPSGGPLWLDTFDVQPGEVWQVALYADNPGVWLAHCHNLDHAAAGMVLHLAYEGVSTPFSLDGETHNHPE